MLHIAICDDDINHLEELKDVVQKASPNTLDVTVCASPAELLTLINEKAKPDIVFMDIELGERNGIDTAKEILSRDHLIQIVYVTGHGRYHTNVYETEHACFLQKPVDAAAAQTALELAVIRMEKSAQRIISIPSKGGVDRVHLGGIRYIENVDRRSVVCTTEYRLECALKLSEFEKMLTREFVRCHKSFIVNLARVKRMRYECFAVDDGSCIPISRRMQKQVKETFFNYIGLDR